MIASYVNDNHETWDQFLREFTYEIRTTVNETTGKTTVELFLGRKLITPFQKFVMVSYGTEFAVGDIEKLFDEARRNSKAKHEKWAKYYNKRRKENGLRSMTGGFSADTSLKFSSEKGCGKIKSDYIIKRESNENGIRVGNSDSSSSRYQSSSLEGVPPRSNWSQSSKNSGSGEKREVKGKVTGCKKDHGEQTELSFDHPVNRLMTKGGQSGPEEEEINSTEPIIRSKEASSSQQARVIRREREDSQTVKIPEEPHNNNARK
ncbi:uncharacterized protein TNCV_1619951 [Trichonephila clavipes]|nr:uncharacterized protein TNCV_1619951 [Trichonephila clavipes]